MNEAETRAEYIDPKLKASGWGEIEGSKVLREFHITDGKIQTGGMRGKPEIADYILVYDSRPLIPDLQGVLASHLRFHTFNVILE